jgi:hypothetical protein
MNGEDKVLSFMILFVEESEIIPRLSSFSIDRKNHH